MVERDGGPSFLVDGAGGAVAKIPALSATPDGAELQPPGGGEELRAWSCGLVSLPARRCPQRELFQRRGRPLSPTRYALPSGSDASQITRVVRQHVEDGWKKYIRDAASYRRFSELRGQWAIRRHHQLGWSLKKPFDESVLIWHVATNLCLYHPDTSLQGRQGETTERSSEISNYMIYLLLIRPEMLMPGTRSDLFNLASNKIINNSNGPVDLTEETLVQKILNMSMNPSTDDTISNAGKLAEALMKLDNEEERWNVIQAVWVEMLCYSASRCRGYLHAKSLGDGGECLTIIWLLLSFMGMETLADRHQMSEPPQEEAEDEEEEAAASSSHSLGRADGSEDNFCPV